MSNTLRPIVQSEIDQLRVYLPGFQTRFSQKWNFQFKFRFQSYNFLDPICATNYEPPSVHPLLSKQQFVE